MTDDDHIFLAVRMPDTSFGVGPLRVDLFKRMTGTTMTELLAPYTVQGPTAAPLPPEKPRCTDYLLRVPPSKGLVIPLTPFGALGIAHAGKGALSITYPQALRGVVEPLLARDDVRTSEPQDVQHESHGVLRQFFVATSPGLSFSLSIRGIGEIGFARVHPGAEAAA